MTTPGQWATASRMNSELSRILCSLRGEGSAAQMMAAGLDAIMGSLGAEGVAVIRSISATAGVEPEVLHRAGMIGLPATSAARLLQCAEIGTPVPSVEPNTRPIVVAVCRQTSDEKFGMVLWRCRGARDWTGDDMPLVDSLAGIVCLLMDRGAGPCDVFHAAPTDPLTALLSLRTFITEVTRHIARLDGDGLPGTLMLAEVDNLAKAGPLLGPNGGDQVLRRAAMLLRSTVRPTDLVGRIGGAEFAVWIGGADHMTAAERAEDLCLEAPCRVVGPDNVTLCEVSFSIGIATRQIGESFSDLAGRAAVAMQQVKCEGGGYWRVSLGRAA